MYVIAIQNEKLYGKYLMYGIQPLPLIIRTLLLISDNTSAQMLQNQYNFY